MRGMTWALAWAVTTGCGGASAPREVAKQEEIAAPAPAEPAERAKLRPEAARRDAGPVEAEPAVAEASGAATSMDGAAGLGLKGTGVGGGGGYAGGVGMLGTRGGADDSYARRGPAGAVEVAPEMPAMPLKAGSTDDNKDLAAFSRFVEEWSGRPGVAGVVRALDTRDPVVVRVIDADGSPVPGARVVARAGRSDVAQATTYGDGRAPLYPRTWSTAQVELFVEHRGARVPVAGTGGEATVRLPHVVPDAGRVPVDVAFILDTTGSMGDEIARIQGTLREVVARVGREGQAIDLRLGAVLYRDVGDEYVTRRMPLSADVQTFDRQLQAVSAGGGGDTPESLNQGLSEAVHALAWRDGAAHVAFLIADAEPHMDYRGDVPYTQASLDAVGRGLRVHAVAASGLGPAGTVVFRQVAQATRGEFIFIEYGGSAAATAASHGVASEQVASNNLDDILYRRIQAEVNGWRR